MSVDVSPAKGSSIQEQNEESNKFTGATYSKPINIGVADNHPLQGKKICEVPGTDGDKKVLRPRPDKPLREQVDAKASIGKGKSGGSKPVPDVKPAPKLNKAGTPKGSQPKTKVESNAKPVNKAVQLASIGVEQKAGSKRGPYMTAKRSAAIAGLEDGGGHISSAPKVDLTSSDFPVAMPSDKGGFPLRVPD